MVAATTALPLTNSVRWWVRMWDFPRLHIAVLALALALVAMFIPVSFKPLLIAVLLVCGIYHAYRIYPYTPLARKEIHLVDGGSANAAVSIMSANVLMENTRYDDLIAMIEREDPDVLFLMETDQVWHDALQGTLKRYSTTKFHLTDDHYGLIFATRLGARNLEFFWPANDDTPAVKVVLEDPNGVEFNFVGVHPRPPVPGNDTAARDEQIKNAAQMTGSADLPTVCVGDFNDVAWSWTTRRFKRYGGFLEPRVGRGMISSFHTKYWFMRLPIDQFFITERIDLVSFGRLENFGSDHFPITATIKLDVAKTG